MDDPKHFITRKGLQQLDKYSYKSFGYTCVDRIMNVFWQYLAGLFPKNIAPNLITFIGFIFMVLSYVIMLFYDHTFTKDIPVWCFYLTALFIFLYMNLDAIDGKQARNIKAASPLGQLFDHGCDSFTLTFFVLSICQAAKLSPLQVFLVFISSQLGFFTANWNQYHTGLLRTKIGQFGVTQVQFVCIFIHLLTGYYGQSIWSLKVGDIVPDRFQIQHLQLYKFWMMNIKTVIVYIFSTVISLNLLYVYFFDNYQQNKKMRVAAEFLSLYLLIAMQLIWFNYLPIYIKYSGYVLLNFGLLLSLIICKLIVCSVTKMKFQYFHKQMIVFIISTCLLLIIEYQHSRLLNWNRKQLNDAAAYIFWVCFAINIISIFRFVHRVIKQLTDYLGLYCFLVDRKTPQKDFKIAYQ